MRREDGFTLIELMVVLSIMTVVLAAVGTAIITVLKITDDTSSRMSESHDAQLASAYFANDVESAVTVTTTSGGYGPCGNSNAIVNFEWKDIGIGNTNTAVATSTVASYATSTVGTQIRLERQFCERGPSSAVYNLARTDAIATLVQSVSPLSCDPVGCACPQSVSPGFCTVTLDVTDNSGYRFTLTGTRRGRGPT